ncbi:E3 ubiquitin-protein ligase rnf146-like [Ctenocephalides felis]|uniref:E3 ubiquitin-protein ligase rnf146-like n=1 Tax=Ctenocephalides felis TaxID=7515 RepID=UPI000E6E1F77|nr:E3 ubiquitin-protein ligase rnf146-like [Ctenocephalides felis]
MWFINTIVNKFSQKFNAMAQGNSEVICLDDSDDSTVPENKGVLECPVCLQTCIHPARLPCGHIFCFLCVKGVAFQSNRCALCRADIPINFLEHPYLVENYEEPKAAPDSYQWFYEGRNGWWQYDERTSMEIESSYAKNEKFCELLIAGFIYIIDFESMMQIRRNEPHRRRQIKRDIATIQKKGVAGIRTEGYVDNGNYTEIVESNENVERDRIQFPESFETNIAYQNLDHSNVLDNTYEDSETSDNENNESVPLEEPRPIIDLTIEFDNFIINRIRELNINQEQTSDNEE